MIDSTIKIIIYGFMIVINLYNVESAVFPNDKVLVRKNSGFYNYIEHPVKFKLHKCMLKLEDGTSYDLDPTSQEPLIYKTTEGVIIQRFNKISCGVRVKNIAESMAGNWTLVSESDRQEIDEDSFILNVLPNKVDKSPLIVKLQDKESSQSTKCPNTEYAPFCRVTDQLGKVFKISDIYQFEFSVSATQKETLYNCYTMRHGQMDEIKSSIKVVLEEKPSLNKGTINESDTHFTLECQDDIKQPECRIEMPGKKKQMLIRDGLLTEHYSTYGTQSNKGQCSLEIEKPLKPEDIGTWRMYTNKRSDSGCVFRLQDNSPIPQSNANDHIKIEYWNVKSDPLTIECEVPYQIDYCYLSTPDFPENQNFSSLKPNDFEKTKFLGICRFEIKSPISGVYVCGVNSISGGEDLQTYYDVKVFDVPVKTSTSFIQGAKGQLIDLMVKTIFDLPINYCRFMMPNGQIHGVSERFNMTGPLRFYGKGLPYGECGIQIVKINDDDFGVWKATFQIKNIEYSIDMVLTKQGGFSVAYVAGPILAVFLIGGLTLGYFVYRKRSIRNRRRRYDRTIGTTTDDLHLDNRSEASHES